MIKRCLCGLFVGLPWCVLKVGVFAQSFDAMPTSVEPASAYLRGWIVGSDDPVLVWLVSEERKGEEPVVFVSATAGEEMFNSDYIELLAGSVELQLKTGEKLLKNTTVDLDKGRFYTLLVWRENGKWRLDCYDDGPPLQNVSERPLRLMNFAEDRETLFLVDSGLETKMSPHAVQELNMAPKVFTFSVRVLSPDGGPAAQSSGEVDLVSMPSAYVVIAPDYRGRMRPRVIDGGYAPSLE
jgi:hypothetical protein